VAQFEFVLKGRGFSRAVNAAKSIAALAAEGIVFQTELLPNQPHVSGVFPTDECLLIGGKKYVLKILSRVPMA
jgi:hypothetical protein